tara:strand:- start:3357 stop:3710 length:354 start_codon:yes stop_codon:yes gene_type:complete
MQMQEIVQEYLKLEREIDNMNGRLKTLRERREKLGSQICNYCHSKGKNAIKLQDDSVLRVCNNIKYQSLTYSMLEKNLINFNNTSQHQNIPIKDFLLYLKNQRERTESKEIKHQQLN